jgi:DNA mismatch repair ATPase MutL
MNELENRFYSRAEISEATGISANASQFARDVKKKLADEGYAYEWINRRGVQILSRTVTPLMELKKLLVDLIKNDNIHQCPHGRPILITQTKKSIEKSFKRI